MRKFESPSRFSIATEQATIVITYRKASDKDIHLLSEKLTALLQDKTAQVYQDNVAKFGIPDEYVQKAFSESSLLKSVRERGSTFYLAVDGNEILGFAQMNPQDQVRVELDRIVIFPEFTQKGIGTLLLREVLHDQARKDAKTVIVSAGKDETHARRFYEKNGFKATSEATIDAPWGSKLSLVTYELQL